MLQRKSSLRGAAVLAGLSLLVSGCATGSPAGTPAGTAGTTAASAADPADKHGRVAVSFPGGISVLDGTTLEEVETFESEEFTRLNAAGDGRHIFVTTTAGFQLLDTVEPKLTDLVVDAAAAGHVVRHAGNTVLFDDGTGTTTILETDELATADGTLPDVRTHTADSAHHGVSIVLEDGTLLTTVGDSTSRTGAVALEGHDDHWHEIAESNECPGIHGEGTAAGEAVVFGCEDGALLFQNGTFEKLTRSEERRVGKECPV